jgi:NAD-dependent deacetylase
VTDPAYEEAAALIRSARKVFVLAGAGMSTESGIPDFRGPDGLWTMNPGAMRMFDLEAYRSEPDVRRKAWQVRLHSEIRTAQPNEGHRCLAAWPTPERPVTIATQNIDGLQQRAGSRGVLELHGTFWQSMCLDCNDRRPIEQTFQRLEAGEEDPACLVCGGILKTGTVAFGQPLDVRILTEAAEAAQHCDVALAIGTSLIVQPAALLCDVAVKSGSPLVVINSSETPYDDVAALVIREPIGRTLSAITRLL